MDYVTLGPGPRACQQRAERLVAGCAGARRAISNVYAKQAMVSVVHARPREAEALVRAAFLQCERGVRTLRASLPDLRQCYVR